MLKDLPSAFPAARKHDGIARPQLAAGAVKVGHHDLALQKVAELGRL
jgi:hypothetical protein